MGGKVAFNVSLLWLVQYLCWWTIIFSRVSSVRHWVHLHWHSLLDIFIWNLHFSPLVYLIQKTLDNFYFQSSAYVHIWWRWFQKRLVYTILDIYAFIKKQIWPWIILQAILCKSCYLKHGFWNQNKTETKNWNLMTIDYYSKKLLRW